MQYRAIHSTSSGDNLRQLQRDHPQNYNDNVIVASTRIFLREISLGHSGKTCWVGGIGEVCTDPSHRRQGLAKRLLHRAIEVMREYKHDERKLQYSLLHASPALMKVYETSANYRGVATHWNILTLQNNNRRHKHSHIDDNIVPQRRDLTLSNKKQLSIRLASFPKDTVQLQRIHKEYSQDRFVGCIIRTRDYWNEYLSKEIGDSMFVLCSDDDQQLDKILSWMSIKDRSDTRIQLRDFGCCKKSCRTENISMATVFSMLLHHILATDKNVSCWMSSDTSTSTSTTTTASSSSFLELAIPSPIYQELLESSTSSSSSSLILDSTGSWLDQSIPVREEYDPGWMYKNLQGSLEPEQDHDGLLQPPPLPMEDIGNTQRLTHLIWPADSF
jgi:Predicted acetyltransferase involved in intracellular survival and related acetyltransferases